MLVRKFHAALPVAGSPAPGSANLPIFSRQGHWDGGSTLHCAAMALALLGRLDDPVWLPYHEDGAARTFWDRAWPHYLHGLTLAELAGFIAGLQAGLRPVERYVQAADLVRFCNQELDAGWPVIVGWQQRLPVTAHAALVTGIEGRRTGRATSHHALLLLDPAGDDPGPAGFNARLDLYAGDSMVYGSAASARAVLPEGALSIRISGRTTTVRRSA